MTAVVPTAMPDARASLPEEKAKARKKRDRTFRTKVLKKFDRF
jgi:hypothetical protein